MPTTTKLAAAAVATAALAATALTAAPAQAKHTDYAQPEVAFTGRNVHVSPDGSKAYVLAKYRCWGGRQGTHLWVSVKQGPELDLDKHSSSQYADSWYDTNWNYADDPAGLTVDCDGHWHATRFVLKPEEGFPEPFVDGPALVQFCLFDSRASDDLSSGFAFDYHFRTVRVPGTRD